MAPGFHVAIVGGGIGGLACALSLAHHSPSLRIDVYEQAAQYSEIGAGVGIGVNAARILHRLGVGAEVNAISGERNNIHRTMRRWDNGDEIVTIGADYDKGEIKQLSVHRAELLGVLHRAIEKRRIANLHTNKRCVKVEVSSYIWILSSPGSGYRDMVSPYIQFPRHRTNTTQDAGDKVVASFEDGTYATVDLLVGADGIHSNIRQQFVADGNPRYSGRIAYRGLFPLKEIASFWPFKSYAVSWLAKDKHFLVFPVSQNKTMNVVAFITKSEDQLGDLKESWTSVGKREDLEKEYEGWDETLCKVIKCMGPNPGKWRLNDRNPLEQWTYMDGKTVLLGDAAHAMLPHQGMFLILILLLTSISLNDPEAPFPNPKLTSPP